MIRTFLNWFDRNPLVAVWVGFIVCFIVLEIAHAWDVSETNAIRQQNMSHERKST